MKDKNYLKLKGTKLNLLNDGVNVNDVLSLTFYGEKNSFDAVKTLFSDIEKGIEVYGAILQDDGKETDEFTAAFYDNYVILVSITYNIDSDTYTVKMRTPDMLEMRISELERKIKILES